LVIGVSAPVRVTIDPVTVSQVVDIPVSHRVAIDLVNWFDAQSYIT
jgi:hypothetical protein